MHIYPNREFFCAWLAQPAFLCIKRRDVKRTRLSSTPCVRLHPSAGWLQESPYRRFLLPPAFRFAGAGVLPGLVLCVGVGVQIARLQAENFALTERKDHAHVHRQMQGGVLDGLQGCQHGFLVPDGAFLDVDLGRITGSWQGRHRTSRCRRCAAPAPSVYRYRLSPSLNV